MKPFLVLLNLSLLAFSASAVTDPNDVSALQVLYSSLGSPPSLTSWTSSNGDPCGQSWAGVKCSGSSVTEIHLDGRGLTGTLSNAYNLGSLKSLLVMDLSNNQLSGNMPYSIPPNIQTLNVGSNSFNGTIPWAFSTVTSLATLQLNNNQFSGSLPDIFTNLGNLSVLDLSFNKISGSLPPSLSDLSSLISLYLQNNQFSGELNVLADLKLHDLNVENNQFTGWVPASFSSIPDVRYGGNSFSSSPAPPPPPYTPPPPVAKSSQKGANSGTPSSQGANGGGSKSSVSGGAVGGIVVAAIVGIAVAGLIAGYLVRKRRDNVNDEEKMQSTAPVLGLYTPDTQEKEKQQFTANLLPPETVIKPPPSESFKEPIVEKFLGRKTSSRRGKSPISAVAYSVADLQQATDSFSQENLIGSGSLGPVYKAELSNGKLLAIKKINESLSASTQKEEDFMEIVSSISRLRHANLAELVGYCTEHGQQLLVYEYFRRGSLCDTLHSWDDSYKGEFTWNVRVKLALGTARALEYLHEVCQPAVIHHNFKSANILLDDELNPHLADCGFSALLSNSDFQASTVSPNGYSAPEYTMSGVYTWQSNVYSFGVVMLELLTGRKPMDSSRARAEQSLVRWATPQLHDIDALASMVDPSLNGMYPPKSLSRFADIIALCVQPEMEFRPPMSEVVQSLVRLVQRAALNKRKSGEEQRGAGEP